MLACSPAYFKSILPYLHPSHLIRHLTNPPVRSHPPALSAHKSALILILIPLPNTPITPTTPALSPIPPPPSTAANSHSTPPSPTHPAAPTGSNYRPPRPWRAQSRTAHTLGFRPCSVRCRRLCRRRSGPRRGLWLSGWWGALVFLDGDLGMGLGMGAYDDAVCCAAFAGDVAVWLRYWLAYKTTGERGGWGIQVNELAFVVLHGMMAVKERACGSMCFPSFESLGRISCAVSLSVLAGLALLDSKLMIPCLTLRRCYVF